MSFADEGVIFLFDAADDNTLSGNYPVVKIPDEDMHAFMDVSKGKREVGLDNLVVALGLMVVANRGEVVSGLMVGAKCSFKLAVVHLRYFLSSRVEMLLSVDKSINTLT